MITFSIFGSISFIMLIIELKNFEKYARKLKNVKRIGCILFFRITLKFNIIRLPIISVVQCGFLLPFSLKQSKLICLRLVIYSHLPAYIHFINGTPLIYSFQSIPMNNNNNFPFSMSHFWSRSMVEMHICSYLVNHDWKPIVRCISSATRNSYHHSFIFEFGYGVVSVFDFDLFVFNSLADPFECIYMQYAHMFHINFYLLLHRNCHPHGMVMLDTDSGKTNEKKKKLTKSCLRISLRVLSFGNWSHRYLNWLNVFDIEMYMLQETEIDK